MPSELKQIDEMAKLICTYPQCIHYNIIGGCKTAECQTVDIAENLYKQGYRKTSDVAREIIKEIDEALHDMAIEYEKAGHPEYFAVCEMVHHKVIRPIEKKYTEGEK